MKNYYVQTANCKLPLCQHMTATCESKRSKSVPVLPDEKRVLSILSDFMTVKREGE